MPLQVFSAQIRYAKKGLPDALDVTLASGTDGSFFAPSWAILKPATVARREAKRLRDSARRMPESMRLDVETEAHNIEAKAWAEYEWWYLTEMRKSYRAHRWQWEDFLLRDRVVLCCYCADGNMCHRAILRQKIFPKLGAVDCGELATIEAPIT